MFFGKEPYKENWYWTADSPEWAIDQYGEDMHGKGDFIFNNMLKIFLDRDRSGWAYENLVNCADLLIQGKRWPDSMNSPRDAKTWIGTHISRLLYNWQLKDTCKYRSQTNMTRDPYIAFYNTALFLGFPDLVEEVIIPWYCYSPGVWNWRKRLIKGWKHVVKERLNYLMDYANIQSYENSRRVFKR
jgi:hypothetical protein